MFNRSCLDAQSVSDDMTRLEQLFLYGIAVCTLDIVQAILYLTHGHEARIIHQVVMTDVHIRTNGRMYPLITIMDTWVKKMLGCRLLSLTDMSVWSYGSSSYGYVPQAPTRRTCNLQDNTLCISVIVYSEVCKSVLC